jgi:hypothetical protein
MADQLDARIRALVLEVVDSAPVPPTFEDIDSGLEPNTTAGSGHRPRRRVAVAVALAAALTLLGAVALRVGSHDTAVVAVAAKPATANGECTLITAAEILAAAQGRTTPGFGNIERKACEFGPFEAADANGGSMDFWVAVDETVGPRAAARYKDARRLLTQETRLSGLPPGFVGVTGSLHLGSAALPPVSYVAYAKQSEKLLLVGAFPMSSTALDLQVAADPVLPAEERARVLVRSLRHSAEADGIIKGLLVLGLNRL